MRLVLSEYIRTLKERDELDVLLPELLVAMKIIPISRPQRGTRQLGVDVAAVGPDPVDGQIKTFLFVIKQGDLGRNEWDSSSNQAIRPSLNEILDSYIRNRIPQVHKRWPIQIVLVTSGDMKEGILDNWTGYCEQNAARAEFDFWNADKLAVFVEQYLLDEHVFSNEDRRDLRRALALAGEVDFRPDWLFAVVSRQLELTPEGDTNETQRSPAIIRQLLITNLATKLFNHWATVYENTKQALIVSERALLWSWHRCSRIADARRRRRLQDPLRTAWRTYRESALALFDALEANFRVKDGLSVGINDNALLSLIVFEQIGFLGSFGLAEVARPDGDSDLIARIAEALAALILNNYCSAAPRLDDHVTDINLGMLFLYRTGRIEICQEWLAALTGRVTFAFLTRRNFPASSMDELIDDEIALDDSSDGLTYTSWLLPTLADWTVFLDQESSFVHLRDASETRLKWICQQLWHPDSNMYATFYFAPIASDSGIAEAPIILPKNTNEYRLRMRQILENPQFDIWTSAPQTNNGELAGIDYIACRHFRTPVPPFILYKTFAAMITNATSMAPP